MKSQKPEEEASEPLSFKKPQPGDNLVNEKPAEVYEQTIGRLEAQNAALLSELSKQQIANSRLQEKMEEVIKKGGFSRGSRRFRIFLSLVTGFTSRGGFDMNTLAQKPGTEKQLFAHMAGLAQIGEVEAEKKEF